MAEEIAALPAVGTPAQVSHDYLTELLVADLVP